MTKPRRLYIATHLFKFWLRCFGHGVFSMRAGWDTWMRWVALAQSGMAEGCGPNARCRNERRQGARGGTPARARLARVRTSESEPLAVASAKYQRCVSQPTLCRFLCYKLPHVSVYQTTKTFCHLISRLSYDPASPAHHLKH